jgi:hypothetical protein
MADIVFIGGTLAFFAACVAFVRGLDCMVRASQTAEAAHDARA